MGAEKRLGRNTVKLANPPSVRGSACVVGKKEGEGPLRDSFDLINVDTTFGEKSWEKAESRMQALALDAAMQKAALNTQALDYVFAGDLLNQCVGSSFALRNMGFPFLGLYGACSTMAEGLGLSAMMIDGGFAGNTAAITSSHFCSAERQYRMPLEYGGQRTPTAQWTATAAGCVILSADGEGPYVTHVATGQIVDAGIKDANNMGAAMAPAAYETLKALFDESGGVRDMFLSDGVDLGSRYMDCGEMIYDIERQDVHMGGSGCGCSAAVLCGYVLNGMRAGRWQRIVFAGTGALLSTLSSQQGESIPSICHAVVIANA